MRFFFAVVFLMTLGSNASASEEEPSEAFHVTAGLGLDGRLTKDVNPDYSQAQFAGQLFARLTYSEFALELELEQTSRASSSGSLNITSRSNYVALWPRYQWRRRWSPFVSAGVGAYFDHVDTTFQTSTASNSGIRYFTGVGGGISKVFWNHFLIEGELRVGAIQQNTSLELSNVFRVGYTY